MKKTISVIIIVILALGFGWYLFKISGGANSRGSDLDLGNVEPSSQLRDVQPDDHILGSPAAKNTAIVFEDIQCPACAAFAPTLKAMPNELLDTKVIFRHFPLTAIHKNATAAAYASEAASVQGKFWEWVNLAYERQSKWQGLSNPLEAFVEIARDAGVGDLEKFRIETENKTYRERVQTDAREATALNVPGTPTLYFNGVKLELTGLAGIKQQAEKLYK